MYPVIVAAITEAKAALVGASNDAEHDALVKLMQALGHEVPDCQCDGRRAIHNDDCPCKAWEKEGK